jgi:putative flippase GtrA
MTWDFALNRYVTFYDTSRQSLIARYLTFCLYHFMGGALNWLTTILIVYKTSFFAERPFVAACLGIAVGTISTFLFYRLIAVFNGSTRSL